MWISGLTPCSLLLAWSEFLREWLYPLVAHTKSVALNWCFFLFFFFRNKGYIFEPFFFLLTELFLFRRNIMWASPGKTAKYSSDTAKVRIWFVVFKRRRECKKTLNDLSSLREWQRPFMVVTLENTVTFPSLMAHNSSIKSLSWKNKFRLLSTLPAPSKTVVLCNRSDNTVRVTSNCQYHNAYEYGKTFC